LTRGTRWFNIPAGRERPRMPTTRRKLTSILIFALAPLLVFAAVWALLGLFHDPYADWLTVETPRSAVAGRPFDVRVSVRQASEPSILAVSVYVLGWNLKPVGRLPGFHTPAPVHAGDTREFRVDVEPMDKMAYLQFVLWLSPSGDWGTRTAGAGTAPVPVRTAKLPKGGGEFRELRAFVNDKAPNPEAPFVPGGRPPEPEAYPASSALFRVALAVLLVLGGLAILAAPARRGREGHAGGSAGRDRLLRTALSVLLFLLALSELFLVEGRLAGWGRALILRLDVYNFRQAFQKAGLALIAAAAVLILVAARTLRRRRGLGSVTLAATALAGYLALSLAGAMSFHYIDVMRGISWNGMSLVDALKAVCAAVVLFSGVRGFRAGKAPERKKWGTP
jgi:hypothetical protein